MHRRDQALLLALAAIWGASFLFIKLGVEEVEPAVVVLGRIAVGFGVLVPLVLARGVRPDVRAMWVPFLVLGTLNNAVPYWLLAFAETRIDSGLAAVIQAAAPILTVVLATRIDPSQRVRGLRLVGVGVGFVGVALLVGVQEGGQLGVGLLLALPFGLAQLPSEAPPAKAVAAIVALGALSTGVAYLLYFTLIARAGASRAILVTYLVPAFALVYGTVFLDEAVTASALAGLVLILGGTALGTGARLRRRG